MVMSRSVRTRILRIRRIFADWLFPLLIVIFSPLTKVFWKGEVRSRTDSPQPAARRTLTRSRHATKPVTILGGGYRQGRFLLGRVQRQKKLFRRHNLVLSASAARAPPTKNPIIYFRGQCPLPRNIILSASAARAPPQPKK